MAVGEPAEGDGVPEQTGRGALLAGRFEVQGLLGVGGMAEVFQVRDRRSGRELALKVLRPQVAHDPEAAERMRREATLLASIDHPAIVSAEESGRLDDGRVYFAMELLRGETLGARMRRGPMAPEELVPVVAGLASGLAAAHARGVIHRDLKPENIFLAEGSGGGGPVIKILDFGVSKVFGYERLTRSGQILGTPRYMAPEQLTAEHDLDARVDVYAAGAILYEALAGQPPFVASDPAALIVSVLHGDVVPLRSLRVDLPAGLEAVVMGAMHHDRERRPGSVSEVARAFMEHATGAPPAPRPGVPTHALGTMDPRAVPASDTTPARPPGTYSALGLSPGDGVEASPAPPLAAADSHDEPADAPVPQGLATHRWVVLLGASAGVLLALGVLWWTEGFGWLSRPSPAELEVATSGGVTEQGTGPSEGGAGEDMRGPADPSEPEQGVSDPTLAADASHSAPTLEPSEPTEAAPAVQEKAPPSRRRARRRRAPAPAATQRADMAEAEPAPAPAPADDAPMTAAAAMREARRARAAGDAARCVTYVERSMERGAPAPVLRLLGDCHWMANERVRALDAYRRFCRLVPDHPAIGEVRRRVEGEGAACP
jgi:eukaryotic-like serine/threonine-protein kinase